MTSSSPQIHHLYFTEDVPYVTRVVAGAMYSAIFHVYPTLEDIEPGLAESWAMFENEQRQTTNDYAIEPGAMDRNSWVVGDFGFSCPARAFFGRQHAHPVVIQQAALGWNFIEYELYQPVLRLQVLCLRFPQLWARREAIRPDDTATIGNDIDFFESQIQELDHKLTPLEETHTEIEVGHLVDQAVELLELYELELPPEDWLQFNKETIHQRYISEGYMPF